MSSVPIPRFLQALNSIYKEPTEIRIKSVEILKEEIINTVNGPRYGMTLRIVHDFNGMYPESIYYWQE